MKNPGNKKYLASFISLHIHDIILDIYLNYLSDDMMIDVNDNLVVVFFIPNLSIIFITDHYYDRLCNSGRFSQC